MNTSITQEKQVTHEIILNGNPYVITAASKNEIDRILISLESFTMTYKYFHSIQHLEEVTFNEGASSFFEENELRPLLFNFIDLLGNYIQNIAQFKKDVMAKIEENRGDANGIVDFFLMMYKLYSLK